MRWIRCCHSMARFSGRNPHRRRRRHTAPSRQRRHRREFAAGADLRSRLSRGLVAGRDRFFAALAGAGGAADKIRRPSPVGSRKARSFVHARHARRGGCSAQDPRPVACRWTARAEHRAPASVQLVDADQMARSCGKFFGARPAQRHKTGGARQRPPARPQEQKGGDRRYFGHPAQHLRRRPSRRRARPRPSHHRLRLRRPPPQRNCFAPVRADCRSRYPPIPRNPTAKNCPACRSGSAGQKRHRPTATPSCCSSAGR